MVVLAGFVLDPPIWDFQQNVVWYKFAHFVLAALLGLSFLPLSKFSSKKHSWKWFFVSSLVLVVGISSFFEYQTLRETWTVEYAKRPMIIGSTYLPDAISYKDRIRSEEHREVSDKDLLMDAAGKREEVWDQKEIQMRGRLLAGSYLGTIVLLALSVLTILQTIYCSTRRK